MNGILKTIWDNKRTEVREAKAALPEAALLAEVRSIASAGPCRGFARALEEKSRVGCAVIAEIKKASPSKGLIRPDFRPSEIALSYEEGGAACLSVLTESKFFLGSPGVLAEARAAVSLPILRKDFLLDPYQVLEARAWGADAVLLIAAALSQDQMRELADAAALCGLDILVESHNEAELLRSIELPGAVLGINNRDLETFNVSLATTERLKALVPEGRLVVTESGILKRGDVERMLRCGVRSFLVGEAFMRKENPGLAIKELFRA